jgi:DinB superfamily
MELCEDCGFDFDMVSRDDITRRATAGVCAASDVVAGGPLTSLRRPIGDRWSAVEYAAHVRDVLLTIRDRLVIGLVEDNPGFKPLYRDERINLGLYRRDTADEVAAELHAAGAMFARLFDEIDPHLLSRPVQYGFPDPSPRTLLWMGRQAVHEVEHHLGDIQENLRTLALVDDEKPRSAPH